MTRLDDTATSAVRYEAFALRIGSNSQRTARENFFFDGCCGDPNAPMPLDYFFWVLRSGTDAIVVDTGFAPGTASRRDRVMYRQVPDALAALGVDGSTVRHLVITHLHWDHAGNLGLFPNATVHVQEAELRFCTGEPMCQPAVRKTYEADDVLSAIATLFDGRLKIHKGAATIAPGITLHSVGGHTPGSQVVRVMTERGWIVLASDASHLWANIRRRAPFPILDSFTQTLQAFEQIDALADGPDHVIPGHDPEVARRFPAMDGDPHVFCLHKEPTP